MTAGVKPDTLLSYKERLLRVLVTIQERLDERLPLEELAALACFSPHHFHHVFTGMVGESLASHVRRLRLERAASRLKRTDLPVVEIALEAGFESHEAFTRAFRGNFGVSPSQFRKRDGVAQILKTPSGIHYGRNGAIRDFQPVEMPGEDFNVTINRLKPLRVAFVRHVGPYREVGAAWDKLLTTLGREGWIGGEVQFIGICHDDPAVTPPDKVRYDACVTVDSRFRAHEEIGVQTIRGGDYAVLTHFGPYEALSESYSRLLGQWLPRSGRRLRSAPGFEVYFNSPENTAPEDLVTDIHAALETRRDPVC